MAHLRGMTWSHRRAVAPLLATLPAFRERRPDVEITWHERPLSGFEFQSVRELSETFDMIILDHPFAGDIASGRYLLPLDNMLVGREKEFVGPSLATYCYGGSIWALPVDAACQVAVASIAAADASAKLANKGCVVDVPTGTVTITVRKEAKTILVGRLSFTKHFSKVTATETNGPTSL